MNRFKITHILLLLLALYLCKPLYAQNSINDMRKKAENIQKQIAAKEKILRSSQKDVQSKMQDIELLTAQIKERKALIDVLNKELRAIEDSIKSIDTEIEERKKNIDKTKEEYSQSLRRAQRYGTLQNKLFFIVSAKDFNTMIRRYRYTQEYMNAHKELGIKLKEQVQQLAVKRTYADSIRADKSQTIGLRQKEQNNLLSLEKEQRKLVADLKRQSSKVQKELNRQKKQLNNINKEIDRIIERELEAQRKREQQAKKSEEKEIIARENEGVKKMSGSFLQNKGKLPVPLTGPYHIVSGFGKHKGVMGKGNVQIDNGGIVLQGENGAKARCIFEGKVTAIFRNADYAFILIRHGDYISVYSQLDKIYVKTGDKVKAGDILADIAQNVSGHTRMLFQLRKEKEKLNPTQWLKL